MQTLEGRLRRCCLERLLKQAPCRHRLGNLASPSLSAVGFFVDQGCRKRLHPVGSQFAFKEPVPARRVQGVALWTTESHVRDLAVGHRQDALNPAGWITDLDPHARGDINAAVGVDLYTVRTRVVGEVRHRELEETLFKRQTAVCLDLIRITQCVLVSAT